MKICGFKLNYVRTNIFMINQDFYFKEYSYKSRTKDVKNVFFSNFVQK